MHWLKFIQLVSNPPPVSFMFYKYSVISFFGEKIYPFILKLAKKQFSDDNTEHKNNLNKQISSCFSLKKAL